MAPHYRIHLVNTVAPDWELPYLVGHTVVATTDIELVRAAAAEIAASTAIDGVPGLAMSSTRHGVAESVA